MIARILCWLLGHVTAESPWLAIDGVCCERCGALIGEGDE